MRKATDEENKRLNEILHEIFALFNKKSVGIDEATALSCSIIAKALQTEYGFDCSVFDAIHAKVAFLLEDNLCEIAEEVERELN